MKRLVIMVKKPANQFQVTSIIEYSNPDEIIFLVKTLGKRLTIDSVSQWESVKAFSGQKKFYQCNTTEHSIKTFKILLKSLMPFSHIAMTYDAGVVCWGNAWWLRKHAEIIHIADGSCDNTSIFGHLLCVKTKITSLPSIIKQFVLPPIIYFCKADTCFHPYYPTYNNCYSKKTKSLSCLRVSKSKQELINRQIKKYNPTHFIFGSNSMSSDSIATHIGIENYICTSKNKELLINGVRIPIKDYICAEELFEVFQPKAIISMPSDIVLSAKVKYPDIPCYVAMNLWEGHQFGTFRAFMFKVQTKKYNIHYVKNLHNLNQKQKNDMKQILNDNVE